MQRLDTYDYSDMSGEQIDNLLASRILSYEKNIIANGNRRPKREGYIMERICTMENLREAFHEAKKKKSKNKLIKKYGSNLNNNLRALQLMLLTGNLPEVDYIEDDRKSDAGKVRRIVIKPFAPWHIIDHAVVQVIAPIICKSLIYMTFSCIKGKGLHFGAQRFKKTLRLQPQYTWRWQSDCKKFYQSIPHELILNQLRSKFKDEQFIELIEKTALFYHTDKQTLDEIEHERERTRFINRRLHKSAFRQLCSGEY
jgi:hypothetical protein